MPRSLPTIRPARPEDLPALGRLGAKLARAHHELDGARFFLPDEPLEAGYEWWLGKELRNRRAVVLTAETARGRIVGYAYGRLEPRNWNMLRDACGEAVDLWVEPEGRRAGLGGRLTDALVAALEARGAERVVLFVASRNPNARKLFRTLGFRPTMLEMARERGTARPSRRARPSATLRRTRSSR